MILNRVFEPNPCPWNHDLGACHCDTQSVSFRTENINDLQRQKASGSTLCLRERPRTVRVLLVPLIRGSGAKYGDERKDVFPVADRKSLRRKSHPDLEEAVHRMLVELCVNLLL